MPSGSKEIRPPAMGQWLDVSRRDMPEGGAKRLQNFVYRDGEFRSRPGLIPFADNVGQRPMAFAQYKHSDETWRLVMATVDGWFKYNGTTETWTDITEAGNELTGSRANHQIFRTYPMSGDITLIGINGQDAPKKWNGTDAAYSDLAGTPPLPRVMAISFNRVIFGHLLSGVGESPYGIDASSANNPEAGWNGDNVALLADTPGEIVNLLEMGNLQTAIYKSDAVYVGIASPSLYPFTYQLKQAGIQGPVSAAASLRISDGLHVWLAKDGSVNRFEGISVSSLSRAIQVHIQRTMNPEMTDHAFGFYDSRREEIWFLYASLASDEAYAGVIISKNNASVWPIKWGTIPMTVADRVSITTGLTFEDFAEAHTTFAEIEGTFGELNASLSKLVFAGVDGQCYQESGSDDDGDDINLICETGFQQLSKDPRQYVEVDAIDHFFEPTAAAQEVEIELGVSDDGRDPEFGDGQTLDLGEDGPYVTEYRTEGRMIAVKMTADATQPVIWRGSTATGRAKGVR